MNAHTPLPWALIGGTNDGPHHIVAVNGPIARVAVQADAAEQQANADLLLAAPELLAALKRLGISGEFLRGDESGDTDLCFMDCYLNADGHHHAECAACRAAIAKAEGRS